MSDETIKITRLLSVFSGMRRLLYELEATKETAPLFIEIDGKFYTPEGVRLVTSDYDRSKRAAVITCFKEYFEPEKLRPNEGTPK